MQANAPACWSTVTTLCQFQCGVAEVWAPASAIKFLKFSDKPSHQSREINQTYVQYKYTETRVKWSHLIYGYELTSHDTIAML